MRLRWVAMVVVLGACRPSGVSDVLVSEVPDFGEVPLGARRVVQVEVQNPGKHSASLSLTATEPFFVEESTRELAPNTSASLRVGINATSLGTQTGELRIVDNGVETLRTLRAEVKGPVIDVATEYRFTPTYFISTGTPEVTSASLIVRNVGTEGSLLTLGTPRTEGSTDLCAGAFISDYCQEWAPAPLLEVGDTRVLPLQLRLTRAGSQSWTVVLPSTDPLRPEVRITVSAEPTTLETCHLEGTVTANVARDPVDVSLTHRGTAPCLVRSIAFLYGGVFTLEGTPVLPLELSPDEGFTVRVSAVAGVADGALDRLDVLSAGGARHEIPVRRDLSYCLEIAPTTIDLGTVRRGCSTSAVVELKNACAQPLLIPRVGVVAAAGEGPGGPNCPGSAVCPEFSADSWTPTTLAPDAGRNITVRYAPINYGADTGAVAIELASATFVVALQGRGDSNAQQTDTFRMDERIKVDVLAMVDTSPSFASQRAAVRSNFAALISRFGGECHDTRWAFATADGDPDAGVRLSVNDAGEAWTSSRGPDFVGRAMSAYDSLPLGSEVESCVGPASRLVADAGVRPRANLAGLCVTDALEQSPNPTAALAQFRSVTDAGLTSWSSIAAYGASCGAEAIDDGVHAQLVTAANGVREDVCSPTWHSAFGFPIGNCRPARGPYYLNSTPGGAVVVEVDGATSDPSHWSYDAATNAIAFVTGFEPEPGQTITVRYGNACTP